MAEGKRQECRGFCGSESVVASPVPGMTSTSTDFTSVVKKESARMIPFVESINEFALKVGPLYAGWACWPAGTAGVPTPPPAMMTRATRDAVTFSSPPTWPVIHCWSRDSAMGCMRAAIPDCGSVLASLLSNVTGSITLVLVGKPARRSDIRATYTGVRVLGKAGRLLGTSVGAPLRRPGTVTSSTTKSPVER